ncbi:aminotransferase class I/II-fold pyridoxal phosphate-dependent enzyme [Streptomyces sp. NBC_00237]|uniref:aminotransferase class I/II-fold pyridoxal phosphate-dependent enzyme n=1 Tax=Streptomyces sp. NBC_00237 TaxID=2975687 RepID=UPI00225C0DD7|nr:aminotransferase class I/II-fold pyridoxal phosphate-dependent enzyme [Streptomyces sp. NBC_00237]MCX5203040.1 aminotransferase class I/II-fold pyridoxal phosphate-dependent enzyme [Streptomyces sp. NBC_00237]
MQRTAPEDPARADRGRVRHGPPAPDPGLPVLPELAAVLAAAADRTVCEPPGGGAALRTAAAGHLRRRGIGVDADGVVAAPGGPTLLFALLAAADGDVLLPRPCPAWWAPQVRLLAGDRSAFHVPTPAECGGAPDPYALLETVGRVRAEGGNPRLLLLCVPDDPTGTLAPPETVRAVCEVALAEGLTVISDETWRDTVHRPRETVFFSPAEMFPDHVVVLGDLAGALTPTTWPVAVARLPATEAGAALRARVLDVLAALGATVPAPFAEAAAYALHDPQPVVARAASAAALNARVQGAVHAAVLAAGAFARPPVAGRHLYADLGPLREGLAERGVTDSMELEEYLTTRLNTPVPGGHRFGDPLGALRVRLSTAPLLGATPGRRTESLTARDPLELPHLEQALNHLGEALAELGRTRRTP